MDDTVTYFDDCNECHVGMDRFGPYEENYHDLLDNEYDNGDWQFYYTIPWWEEDKYYNLVTTPESGNRLPPTQKRSVGRRHTTTTSPAISSSPGRPAAMSKNTPKPAATSADKRSDQPSKRNAKRRNTDRVDKPKLKKKADSTDNTNN